MSNRVKACQASAELLYPGGAFGYDYDWQKPNLPAEITTDQFLSMGDRLDATQKISVNPNASPELAAAWVGHTRQQASSTSGTGRSRTSRTST